HIYFGGSTPAEKFTFQASPPPPGSTLMIQVTAGDYDGDRLSALAVLRAEFSSNAPADGQIYIFRRAGLLSDRQLAFADIVVRSGGPAGVLDNLSPTPSLDLNADGISDLLAGASRKDVVHGTVFSQAGAVYLIYGVWAESDSAIANGT